MQGKKNELLKGGFKPAPQEYIAKKCLCKKFFFAAKYEEGLPVLKGILSMQQNILCLTLPKMGTLQLPTFSWGLVFIVCLAFACGYCDLGTMGVAHWTGRDSTQHDST